MKQPRPSAATLLAEALAHHRAGRLEEAERRYRAILANHPGTVDARHLLGVVRHQQGHHAEALGHIDTAIRADGRRPEFHSNQALVLLALGRAEDAAAAFRHALSLDAKSVDAHLGLAGVLLKAGAHGEAFDHFERALALDRRSGDAALGLGMAARRLGRLEQAADALAAALAAGDDAALAHVELAHVRDAQARTADALAHYEAALAIDPDLAEAHANAGAALLEFGRPEDAAAAHRRALGLRPSLERARWGALLALPVVYRSADEIEAWRGRWCRGLDEIEAGLRLASEADIAAAVAAATAGTNFLLHYQGRDDTRLQARFGALLGRIARAAHPRLADGRPRPARAGKRIRVGYATSYFTAHSIANTHGAWLTRLDRARFETFLFFTGARADAVTGAIAARTDHYLPMPRFGAAEIAAIAAAGLDALVFPDIGMDPRYQLAAALRLAPLQLNGLGHPVTSGLATVDVALSSVLMEPDGAERHYSERLVRLPSLATCYALAPLSRAQPEKPAHADGPVYLCSQSLFKLLPQFDEVYARIAREAGRCRFRFIASPSAHVTAIFKERLAAAFARHGLDADLYCEVRPRLDADGFLRLNASADVLLDSFLWSGNNTSMQALACGLPAVTLPGPMMRGRHTFAILERIGLTETIAKDVDDYVALAVALGVDGKRRREIAHRVAARRATAFDDKAPIRALEAFLEESVEGR